MQQLTAAPRDGLTEAQVITLLTAPAVEVDYGCDLLDAGLTLVEDISADCSGGTVKRNNTADVHGTVDLTLSRALAWGRDRVRPWMSLTVNGITARFDQGVYVLTTPTRPIGETPVTYAVTGFDLLYLLAQPIADTYWVPAGTTYLQAVRDVVTASGAGSTVLMDGTLQDTPLPTDMVWCLESPGATWLTVANDLLKAIAYRGLWCDESGRFRSEPARNAADRGPEWVFDSDAVSILGQSGTETNDVWSAPNWWRFVGKNPTTRVAEGYGMYTVINQSDGSSSVDSLGRVVRADVQFFDAANQEALAAQGDQVVAADRARTRLIEGSTGPFPIAGHLDVSTLDLPDVGRVKVQAASWSMPLDGGDVSWTWEVVA